MYQPGLFSVQSDELHATLHLSAEEQEYFEANDLYRAKHKEYLPQRLKCKHNVLSPPLDAVPHCYEALYTQTT
jgi:hypothetical protein